MSRQHALIVAEGRRAIDDIFHRAMVKQAAYRAVHTAQPVPATGTVERAKKLFAKAVKRIAA